MAPCPGLVRGWRENAPLESPRQELAPLVALVVSPLPGLVPEEAPLVLLPWALLVLFIREWVPEEVR